MIHPSSEVRMQRTDPGSDPAPDADQGPGPDPAPARASPPLPAPPPTPAPPILPPLAARHAAPARRPEP
ncbi:hypothetical protein QMK28_11780, partial [Streptomyces sp. H27-D2]|nr:hypothetical protein [Streptomyces sp. H27-D2]